MTAKITVLTTIFLAVFGLSFAQESCDQMALDSIDEARSEHENEISALFARIDSIKQDWDGCQTSEMTGESAEAESAIEAAPEMTASEVVDGGHIVEGLWSFTREYTLSDACEERKKHDTYEFYEDVYYNDVGLLIWDAANKYSNYTFEYLLATRFTRSDGGNTWVAEYEITSATVTTMSGTYAGYWHGNRDVWCTTNGTFTAELFDTENACLVSGDANIRTSPSTKSPKNGIIDDQRRVLEKVSGDDGYYWWKLSDDEFVRQDVVVASRSCERL